MKFFIILVSFLMFNHSCNFKVKPKNIIKKEDSIVKINSKLYRPNANKVIEFVLNFKEEKKFISEAYKLDLPKNMQFINLSAYFINTSHNTFLFYRSGKNGNWSEWKELIQDKENHSKKRYVFKTNQPIFELIDEIQFKSEKMIDEKIIFRILVL